MGCNLRLLKKRGVFGEEHPGGRVLAALLVGKADDSANMHAGGVCQQRNLRLEVHMLIGDVEGENAAGGEVAFVEVNGLCGEQVDGDGVA